MTVIVIMGVSGVGKTTVGQALAQSIDATFAEGDSYHPVSNVEKMRNGQPLSDHDRWPWLDRMRTEIDGWLRDRRQVVLACSALKASYRERLCSAQNAISVSPDSGGIRFVYLQAKRDLIERRLAARQGHYMPASLLESQLDALEPPRDAITIDASRPLDDIIADLKILFSAGRNDLSNTEPRLTKS